jgi:hypothetical protein
MSFKMSNNDSFDVGSLAGALGNILGKQQMKKKSRGQRRQIIRKRPMIQKRVNKDIIVMKEPVSRSITIKNSKPKINNKSNLTVTHKELLLNVNTTVGFTTLSQIINPGNSQTFPWLSGVAGNFQKYKFRNLEFIWIPSCATSVPGNVIVAMDYDANNEVPSSQFAMSGYEDEKSGNFYSQFNLKCKNINLNKSKQFLVTQELNPKGDLTNYHLGIVYVGTINGPVTQIIGGQLWVQYTVELINPTMQPSYTFNNQYYLQNYMLGSNNSTISLISPLGTTNDFKSLGTSVGPVSRYYDITGNNSGTTMTFKSNGVFMIRFAQIGKGNMTSTTSMTVTLSTTNGSKLVNPSTTTVGYSSLVDATINSQTMYVKAKIGDSVLWVNTSSVALVNSSAFTDFSPYNSNAQNIVVG